VESGSTDRKLLVVDDEHTIAETLATIFALEGYDVRKAFSGSDALKQIADWNPELAILDVQLPDISGVDLARQIQRDLPSCKLLLFTGNIEVLLEMDSGAGLQFPILQKPVSPKLLISVLGALM
jgi:DNA-binding response OmpR family regulator